MAEAVVGWGGHSHNGCQAIRRSTLVTHDRCKIDLWYKILWSNQKLTCQYAFGPQFEEGWGHEQETLRGPRQWKLG